MAGGGGGVGKRMVKLLCPTISSKVVVQVVAREDQRLDLGSIARAFGLDPATLKLNGHFISRGVDLIASSVTWKSLLSFFSSKGLSRGTSASDALLVHGKPCKLVGSKRAHDSSVFEYGTPSTSDQGYNSVHRTHHLDDINLSTSKRFRDSAIDTASEKVTKVGAFSLKRKHFVEDVNSTKRIRGDDSHLGTPATKRIRGDDSHLGTQIRANGHSGALSKMQLPCSFIGVNKKRLTEDEMITAAPCKKIRG